MLSCSALCTLYISAKLMTFNIMLTVIMVATGDYYIRPFIDLFCLPQQRMCLSLVKILTYIVLTMIMTYTYHVTGVKG